MKKVKTIYNYKDPNKDKDKKKDKIKALHKLLEWIIESDRKFVDFIFRPHIDTFMEIIEVNIFRPIPLIKKVELEAMDEGANNIEPADKSWSTLIVVYEIYIHIIKHPAITETILKYFITESYIQNILDLFESENAEERDYLKQIIHKLYSKVVKKKKDV